MVAGNLRRRTLWSAPNPSSPVSRCLILSISHAGWRTPTVLRSPDYYSGREFVTVDNQKQKSLDLEVKLLENRQWVVKQVREFSGS